jgi:hypothetical protein
VVNGNSLVADRRGSGEYWALFGKERDQFLAWLFENRINGVVFVAGDWHVGTMNRLYRPQDSYPLYEPLASNSGERKKFPLSPETGKGLFRAREFIAQEYRGFNFGLITVSGTPGQRRVLLQIVDENGSARSELQVPENQLRVQ